MNILCFCSDDEITIKELERIVTKARQLPYAFNRKEDDVAWVDEARLYENRIR